MMLVAITGGIGSGKSTVSALLRVMGYEVYDCDARAKALMTADAQLRHDVIQAFGADSYRSDGTLNTRHLAASVFSDPAARRRLDALVHPAVGRDLEGWVAQQKAAGAQLSFYESAILYESGFDRYADSVWCVSAPLKLRVVRTMMRDAAPREAVEARIASQMAQEERARRSDLVIYNDREHSVIEQVNTALRRWGGDM